jgi:hypothetical protein
LEEMMIAAIEQRDPDGLAPEDLCGREAAEAAADDHHMGERRHSRF